MSIVKASQLDELVKKAKESSRKRAHLALHKHSDPVLKLLMAIEPDTYAQPNKHPGEDRQELFIALRGKILVTLFDEDGLVKESAIIGPNEENIMVEVPANVWHTMWSMEEGSVVIEVIKGPYSKATFKEFAPWAPSENDPRCLEYKRKILKDLNIC